MLKLNFIALRRYIATYIVLGKGHKIIFCRKTKIKKIEIYLLLLENSIKIINNARFLYIDLITQLDIDSMKKCAVF